MSAPTAPRNGARGVDVSGLLSLDTDGAHLILGVFIVANVAFTVTTLEPGAPAWPRYIALLIVCAAGVLMVRQHPDPFPLEDTLLVLGAVVLSTVLISWTLPDSGPPGRASWHLGSNTWLLWILIIRGRAGFAWAGAAAMSAITLAWCLTVGRGPFAALTLVQTHLGLLATGQLFVAALRSTARRINDLTERSVDAASAAAAAEATRHVRLQRSAEVAATAVPLLERVASGRPLDDEARRAIRDAEARLRDGVRGRSLAVPAVLEATSRARARGVDVQLLDDRGAGLPSGAAMRAATAMVSATLDAATGGVVTVRLMPAGREAALTMTSIDGDDVTLVRLDEAGTPLTM